MIDSCYKYFMQKRIKIAYYSLIVFGEYVGYDIIRSVAYSKRFGLSDFVWIAVLLCICMSVYFNADFGRLSDKYGRRRWLLIRLWTAVSSLYGVRSECFFPFLSRTRWA